jgi:hypothetical protein
MYKGKRERRRSKRQRNELAYTMNYQKSGKTGKRGFISNNVLEKYE